MRERERNEKRIVLVSCTRLLGDGCLIAIMRGKGKCREEKRKQYDEKKMILKLNSTTNEKTEKEKKKKRRKKKREKEKRERTTSRHRDTLPTTEKMIYIQPARELEKKRRSKREKNVYIYIYSSPLSILNGTLR